MKSPKKILTAAMSFALLFSACKKTEESSQGPGQAPESAFFDGTGIRKLGIVRDSSLTIPASDFPTAAVGYDAATNTVDWIYAFRTYDIYYNYKPGRQHINFTTGNAMPGAPVPANPVKWANETDYYKFVPFSTQLYYPDSNNLKNLVGTAAAVPFTPLGTRVKLYADGRALSYYEDPSPTDHQKFYRGRTRIGGTVTDLNLVRGFGGASDSEAIKAFSLELLPDGSLLEFEASAKEIRVVDANTGLTLARVPNDILNGYPRIDNSGMLITRLSKNGKSVACWIRNTLNNNGIKNPHTGESTTFVYEVATKTISVRISAIALNEATDGAEFKPNVLDEEGNIYYYTSEATSGGNKFGRITKITPNGPVVVVQNFLAGSSGVSYLEVIGGKVFIGAFTRVPDSRGESAVAVTGMLGVVD